ncbi:type IV pilus assembly protein FimV [Aeromonas molluscorum]|uniref:type IV pilus assembly protein FimV n=1 Tax=Aeromonas molluscorum TaxID=271417 RepID=UPI003F1C4E6B
MLGLWLGMALVNISGYQPIAEQTWVSLNPEYYPLRQAPPPIFAAWHGNQYPPLASRQYKGHWQVLFPARLVPPFDLFEGQAQLSRAYLARLERIDEMAYGIASVEPAQPTNLNQVQVLEQATSHVPVLPEFSLPNQYGLLLGSPMLGYRMPRQEHSVAPDLVEPALAKGEGVAGICHKVAPGETLWRIASTLAKGQGKETYSYVLALYEANRQQLGVKPVVKSGDVLRCPAPQLLASFEALTPAERHQQFNRLDGSL